MKTQLKYNHVDVFNNSSTIYLRKIPNIIVVWLFILLVLTIFITILSFLYTFDIYDIYQGTIIKNEKENYLYLLVDEEFNNIKNRNYLIIENEEYKCHLLEFSDDYYLVNNQKFWNAKYECELPDEININNNQIQVSIFKRKTTLGKELYHKIKEAINNARIKNRRT